MNFALSTIIIIIILLPGAIAQRAYFTHLKVKKASINVPYSEMLFRGLILSLFIHTTAICSISFFFNIVPDYKTLYNILQGEDLGIPNEEVNNQIRLFITYSLSVIVSTWGLTKIFKQIIESKNLHLNFYSLRNANYWFELFSGNYLDRKNVKGARKNADLIFVDVLTTENTIYSGFLYDFNYSSQKDQLENIIITTTRKRNFHFNVPISGILKSEVAPIPGDVFIVPAEKIQNINIHYIRLRDVMTGSNQDETKPVENLKDS